MARYHRVNIDGQSLYKTETRVAAAALLPGTFAVIDTDGKFAQATGIAQRLFVVDVGYHQGLRITDANPKDSSVVGNYLEEGREFVLRVAASTEVKEGDALTVGADGVATVTTDTAAAVAYSQDTVTIGDEADFIRVRARYIAATA